MGDAGQEGKVLDGRYRLEGVIGEGGMGTVFRATHLKLERQVAVKILLPEYGESADLRLRFEREAKNLAASVSDLREREAEREKWDVAK